MDPKLEKLKKLLELANEGLSRDEFTKAFQALTKVILRTEEHLVKKIDSRIGTMKDGYTPVKGKDYRDGQDGKTPTEKELLALIETLIPEVVDGETPSEEQLAELIGRHIALLPPETSEGIRNKLELLEGKDRLNIKAIDGVPELLQTEFTKNNQGRNVGGHGALYTLSDVSLAGIIAGQSIQWDGHKWIAYTPAGSGGTPVFGENLTTQGPGTSFALAHTPIVGSVRLFRGGAYQSVANGDYSITGSAITLSNALLNGEVLVVDYSY